MPFSCKRRFSVFQIAGDLRFAIQITNRNRNQSARFGALRLMRSVGIATDIAVIRTRCDFKSLADWISNHYSYSGLDFKSLAIWSKSPEISTKSRKIFDNGQKMALLVVAKKKNSFGAQPGVGLWLFPYFFRICNLEGVFCTAYQARGTLACLYRLSFPRFLSWDRSVPWHVGPCSKFSPP